jgi:hypothetical protein
VRDAAIYPLLGLGPSRLAELFEELRRELLREGRELVLLIEDFAALAGIQKPLLDVVIREGVRDGRRVLCTMRTALAVTDGYLSPWDTVRTRTNDTEWVIAEVPPGEERTMTGIVNLVGAYLNAARIGAEELERAHRAAADPTGQDWVPEFDRTNVLTEDGRRQLTAFGACSKGYPLFPFNRTAIEQLARRYLCTADGQNRLNPRHVIHHILRDPLLAHQSAFADGRFPPGNFCGFSPNDLGPDVKTLLAGRAGEAFDRTAALLGFWGGLPQTPADIRLSAERSREHGPGTLREGTGPGEARQGPAAGACGRGRRWLVILSRCQTLQGLLGRLKQAELDQQRAATLTPVQEALADRRTRLLDTEARGDVLLQAGVMAALSLPDVAALKAALQKVRANLAADPFAVTKGRDYKALLKHLDDLLDQFRGQIVREWAAWVGRQTARIDDAELARYEVLPGFSPVVADVRRLRTLVANLPKELPANDEEFEEAKETLDTLRGQIAKLPRTDDPEIRAFLDAANGPDGASLDLLTRKVVAWLKDPKQALYERHRIVVR